jgi:short-subunit dehydrogenase
MSSGAFRENVVVATGASAGIGRALALRLAGEGAWLALGARDAGRLQEVAEACRARGGRALAVPTDVSNEDACRALIACTVSEYGRVDSLVNNAGISMWARFEEMQTLRPFEEMMRVNYLGSVYCTYHALPYLKQTRGRLVAVSSLAGKSGVPTRSGYAASKHALVGFFDSLRIELSGSGVSVTVVCPDFVASEIRVRAFGVDGGPLRQSPVQEGKVMTAETCAGLIVEAAAARRRELIMGTRGKLGIWLKLIAPGLVDRLALRAITRGR